jgi:hypothetical protein
MRINSLVALGAAIACFVGLYSTVLAQSNGEESVEFKQHKLNGPRLGVTYVLPTGDRLEQKLNEKNIGLLISQFGWHFEWLVAPQTIGPSFVVEAIPLIGGVEYATAIPSMTLVMGIRLPQGFEFGMGPSVMLSVSSKDVSAMPSLIIGLGQSIDYSGVSIPLNLAFATNRDGYRAAFTFGYAIKERKEKKNDES